jgi:hypothetical protein
MALAKSIYAVPTRTRLVALVTEPGACAPPTPLLPGNYACMPDLRRSRTRRASEFGCRSVRPRRVLTNMETSRAAAVELYWIPLGARGHFVRFNGRVFEAIEAARRHRSRCDLYHAGLVVELDGDRYTIELTPSPDADGASRGVVVTGAGSPPAIRSR